jgi:hypothetical protein
MSSETSGQRVKSDAMWTCSNIVAISLVGLTNSHSLAQCDSWHSIGSGLGNPPTTVVRDLAVYDGELIAAGSFNTVVDYIGRWDDRIGQWQTIGGGTNDSINTIAVYGSELIAAGWFTSAGGQNANRIARWNGSTWQPLGMGMSGPVFGLGVFEGNLVAGGWFTFAGGVIVNGIARWNGSIWQPMGDLDDETLHDFAVYDGMLYALGSYGAYRWNGASWELLSPGGGGSVNCLTVYRGSLVFGGAFLGMGGQISKRVIQWNGLTDDWDPLGQGIDGEFSHVDSLTIHNGDLIAGGVFASAGGQPASAIARWNGVSWEPLGEGFGHNRGDIPWVAALTIYDNQLIAAGSFTTAGGQPAINIAAWHDCDLCQADIVDDSEVNIDDLLAVMQAWGACPDELPWCAADIVSADSGSHSGFGLPDGVVDVTDLLYVIIDWGDCSLAACLGDINDNALVNVDDLLLVVNTWGPCPPLPPPPCPADFAPLETGGDNIVDVGDLLGVINAWGPCR